MRRIHLTELEKQNMLTEITKELTSARLMNEGINIKYKPKEMDCPYDVFLMFKATAWLKMQTLVNTCTTECAWHGTVKLTEDRRCFTVEDIMTYPQIVTGTTVNIDDATYETWHQALDDQTYNTLRLQGHSHVKMGVTPSGTDTKMYDDFLQTLSTNSFYIFLIMNQKGDLWVNIYDLAANAIYDRSDITVYVEGIGNLADWYDVQKENFKTHSHTSKKYNADKHGPIAAGKYLKEEEEKMYGGTFDNYAEYHDYRSYYEDLTKADPFHISENPVDVNKFLTEAAIKNTKAVKTNRGGRR